MKSTDAPPHLLSVGDLHWSKGYDYLLAAFARLQNIGLRFTAQIIGSGELQAGMRFSIGDLGLSSIVTLSPELSRDQLLPLLGKSALYILSSHRDTIRPPLLDAMANGLPVVSTRFTGIETVLRDGVDGYITPPRDVPALTARIAELIQDSEKRASMGIAAREHASMLSSQTARM